MYKIQVCTVYIGICKELSCFFAVVRKRSKKVLFFANLLQLHGNSANLCLVIVQGLYKRTYRNTEIQTDIQRHTDIQRGKDIQTYIVHRHTYQHIDRQTYCTYMHTNIHKDRQKNECSICIDCRILA